MATEQEYIAHVKLSIRTPASGRDGTLCKGLASLLQGIRTHGSLSASAKDIGIARSKACKLLDHAEDAFGCKLVSRSYGKGAELTETGLAMLDAWQAINDECQELANRRLQEILRLPVKID